MHTKTRQTRVMGRKCVKLVVCRIAQMTPSTCTNAVSYRMERPPLCQGQQVGRGDVVITLRPYRTVYGNLDQIHYVDRLQLSLIMRKLVKTE